MSPTVSSDALQGVEFEPISISQADFADASDTGESVSAGEVAEVMQAEINDENGVESQFASYEFVRLGDSLDPTGNSAKGKLFAAIHNGDDNAIDGRTEFRLVSRPKNGNRRNPLTNWHPMRNLNVQRPDHRVPLKPVTVNGNAAYVRRGRILAVEARNAASSFTVNRTNSDLEIPARGGY